MKKSIIILLSLFLVLGGCAARSSSNNLLPSVAMPQSAPAMDGDYASKEAFTEESAPMEAPAAPAPGGAGTDASAVDQLIIQNAQLNIVVKDPQVSQEAIVKLTNEVKGYVVSSNLYKSQSATGVEFPEASISIRVPAERLDETLTKIKAMVEDPDLDILYENRSGQNVTKEYTDLKSRLTNLEQAEAQLREIMASATRTEDVLAVFNQLTQIREQIEVIKGQMKYYEESAAMSAVDVTLKSQQSVEPLTVAGWKPEGVARDALQALIDALKFLVSVLIWLVIFLLPILLVIVIPIWVIVRAVRRSRAKRKAANTPPPSTQA
jgi:hypothetical protein